MYRKFFWEVEFGRIEAPSTRLTCIVEAVQHRGLPEVQFTEVHRLQLAAHRIACILQTLQGHALRVILLARLSVHHIGHRHRPVFARLPGGEQAPAVHWTAPCGRAEPHAADHRVLPESPSCGDTSAAARTLTAGALSARASTERRHR